MAECTKLNLRKAREAANLPRWKASAELGVSEDTLKRWEDPGEKAAPTSGDVHRMQALYGVPGLWYSWMYSNDDGFRENMAPPLDGDLRCSVLSLLAEVGGLISQQEAIMRDAADGRIDRPDDRRKLLAKGIEIARAAQTFCAAIREQMKNPA